MKDDKPLGRKAYGSIPHLPGSRLGPGDHHCHEGQARIATEKTRDRHDYITVTVKLDGSCCSVAKQDGQILSLSRSGYLASSSPYLQHKYFAEWVRHNYVRFYSLLNEGERVVGEWLAQAHGTRYNLDGRDPFVIFDLFDGNNERLPSAVMKFRVLELGFAVPTLIYKGSDAAPITEVLDHLQHHYRCGYGELDQPEGAVWRVERKGCFDFLAKYVRSDKEDGCYLPEVSNQPPIWNWTP